MKQRDNEIGILLNYLNKKKDGGAGGPPIDLKVGRATGQNFSNVNETTDQDPNSTQASIAKQEENKQATLYQKMMSAQKPNVDYSKSIKDRRIEFELNQQQSQHPTTQSALETKVNNMLTAPVHLTMDELADRAMAFEKFRKSYRKNEAMEDNRNLLKEKYARGKELGADVNASRQSIKRYSGQIEEIRKQNAMRGLIDENGEI